MRSVARWCVRRRRAVLAAWIVGLIALTAVHGAVGSDYRDTFRLKGTESVDALNLLQRSAPKASGDQERVVFAVDSGRVTDPAVKRRIAPMLARVAKLPHVDGVTSPYTRQGARQLAKDGRVGYATVILDGQPNVVPKAAITKLIDTARDAGNDRVQVQLGGQAIEQARQQGGGGTVFGFVAALIVLLIVFGSVLAAVMPLVVAGISLGSGIAVIGLLSNGVQMATFSSELSLLIGLGVGVDYALFIVTRFRQELLRGASKEEAAERALDTSGRAVMFAGITVCIALLGMIVLGVSFLYGVAIAASIVVAFTVFAALTLLPALLGFLGPKLLTRGQRRSLADEGPKDAYESPAFARWAGILEKRPALFAIGAVVALLVVASPFASIRLGSSDEGGDPTSSTTRKAYDLLADGFGQGFNGPLQLIAPTGKSPQRAAAFKRAVAAAGRDPQVVSTTPPTRLGAVSTAQVVPRGSPQDESTSDLVHRLRDRTLPAASPGMKVSVAGQTAIFIDFSGVLSGKLPLFIGIVVALSFLLLMAVFRSVVIPAMAAVANLLSVAASFGVVVAVFQWGWLASLIGVESTGPIEAFLPVMVFAIIFGLSMDYEVFLVSRIYEEWHKRGNNREAVTHGLAATARTITAAAAIMILVFAAFVLGGERVIKLFGVGLAGAVLIDALIVRTVIIPGLMLIVGERNWWLPGWLDRLIPQLNVEGEAEREKAGVA